MIRGDAGRPPRCPDRPVAGCDGVMGFEREADAPGDGVCFEGASNWLWLRICEGENRMADLLDHDPIADAKRTFRQKQQVGTALQFSACTDGDRIVGFQNLRLSILIGKNYVAHSEFVF